jgi:hypothetical protein
MYSDICVYTIKHSDDLNELLLTTKAGTFREYKNWKGAKTLFDESVLSDKKLIIIFSPAESTAYLHSWAIITDIIISTDNKYTDYSFSGLTKFDFKYKKSDLLLSSSNKNVDPNFIRPYALCKTPLKIINKSISLHDDTIDNFFSSNISGSDNILTILNEKMKNLKPEKVEAIIKKSIRKDSRIVQLLKSTYNYKCQYPGCTAKIKMKNGKYYIEVAHIRPFSRGGKSIIGNLLVLCPNHHKEFDFGDLQIINQTDYLLKGTLNGNDFEIILQNPAHN